MEAKTAAFESPEFGTLSVIFSDNGPWFFGKSVANALRMRDSMYRKSLKAVKEENRKRRRPHRLRRPRHEAVDLHQ